MAFELRIVLVRPRNPLNIGAAARAMANFGFRDLVVVEPYEAAWKEARSAMGAKDVLAAARAVADLSDALADRTLVIGTTAATGRTPRTGLLSLLELPARLAPKNRAALLFGPEKTGLRNEDLSFCHLLVRIPTRPDCPSMNLGQAVAVCCYELSCHAPKAARLKPSPAVLATMEQIEQLRAEWEEVLQVSGYFPSPTRRAADALKLRRFLLRLRLEHRDVDIFRGMLAQVRWRLSRSDE